MNKFNQPCYTYLLGWTALDRWYYGYRGGNKVDPEADLWKVYKSSSKHVKAFIKEHGEPDVIRIHKIFDDRFQARDFEWRFLKRVSAVKSERWINKHNSGQGFARRDVTTEEHRRKISEAKKGFKFTKESKQRMSESRKAFFQTDAGIAQRELIAELRRGKTPYNKGKPMTEEQKQKIRDTIKQKWPNGRPNATGMKRSPETVQKVSAALKGKPQSEDRRAAQKKRMKQWWADKKAGEVELTTDPAFELSIG